MVGRCHLLRPEGFDQALKRLGAPSRNPPMLDQDSLNGHLAQPLEKSNSTAPATDQKVYLNKSNRGDEIKKLSLLCVEEANDIALSLGHQALAEEPFRPNGALDAQVSP